MITLGATDRVLVMHLGGIGDVILATPALRALRQRYPRHHIALLVAAHAAGLLDHCPDIDAQWTLASTRAGFRWWSALGRDDGILQQLRAQHVALAIDLYPIHSWLGSLRMAAYLRQIAPRHSLGYDTDRHGWCFTTGIPESRAAAEQRHETAHALALVQQLGGAPVPLAPQLWSTAEEIAHARERLTAFGISPSTAPLIMSPGAYRRDKRWPPDRFVALGRWLTARAHAPIVVVGDAHDPPAAWVAQQLAGAAVNAVGQTSLRQLLALLALARLVLTHDTGTMHMAAALQRPLVALFGPTNVTRFGPVGDPAQMRVLQPPTHRLRDLAVADVQQAVEELLT